MNPQYWIDRFKANRTGWNEPDWSQPCEIENTRQRTLLAASLATFQLGETGGGSRVMRYVERSEAVPETERERYAEAMALFIAEENRHAEWLGRAVKHLGGKLRQHHWTNFVFRKFRTTLGLEFNLQTLLTAELIAEAYYGILSRSVPDQAVRELCRKIVRDEVGHIAFHRDFFRQQHRGRLPVVTALWCIQFQLLMPILSFTANPTTIKKGQSSTLSWKTEGCDNCFLQPPAKGEPEPPNGEQVVTPQESTVYMLQCTCGFPPSNGTLLVMVEG